MSYKGSHALRAGPTVIKPGSALTMNFDAPFLFASLFWGSVGIGYWIYGKRQDAMFPMLGGVAMIAASCLVRSALLMSLLCVAIAVGVHALRQRGD